MDLKYGVQSAKTGRFRLSRIQDLNDAYEMRCACIGWLKLKVQRELQEKIVKEYKSSPSVDKYGRKKLQLDTVLKHAQNNTTQYLNTILMERKIPEERQKILCFQMRQ